jgi:4-amino-4-deoxy-L-arabinose transferase-like glycosyltransferase
VPQTEITDIRAAKNHSGDSTLANRNGRFGSLTPIILLSAIVIALFFASRPDTSIKVGADEDYELTKALLYAKGYRFYTEVWNDQPLLHTAITGTIHKNISSSVFVLRAITACFTVLLITSFYMIVRKICDVSAAAVAGLFLILSPGFVDLSSSCMVEIPALAPAVAGLAALMGLCPKNRKTALVLGGILFGVAFQIKLINLILLPIVGLVIWLKRVESQAESLPPEAVTFQRLFNRGISQAAFVDFLVFGGSLAVAFFGINFLLPNGDYLLQVKQTWTAHFAPAQSFEYGSPNDYPFDWSVLLKAWEQTIPACVGIAVCLWSCGSSPWFFIPFVWLALEFVVFGIHRPWWSYYYVHNALPTAWCAAIGIMATVRQLRKKRSKTTTGLFYMYAVFAAVWMGSRAYLEVSAIRRSPQTYNSLVLQQVEVFKTFAKTIYTDEGVYSFHTGIPLPPKLGIVSLKRFWSGDMTNEKLRDELWTIKPELFLLVSDARERPYQDLLQSQYSLVYDDQKHRLYVRKDVVKQAKW